MSDDASLPLKERETSFQKNWRPALGWTVVGGFAFALILLQILNFLVKILYWHPGDAIPQIDKPDTVLLLEAAGLAATFGGFRMYEKLSGVAGGPPKS